MIEFFDSLFAWLALEYGAGPMYLIGSKICGVLCSFADIAMIWMLLRLRDEVRGGVSKRRYAVLAVFAALTPTLLLPDVSTDFFILQFIVLGLPYMILVGTIAFEAKHILRHIRETIAAGAQRPLRDG